MTVPVLPEKSGPDKTDLDRNEDFQPLAEPRVEEPGQGSRENRDRLGLVMTWLCGGAMGANLVLILCLLLLIGSKGLGFFWLGDMTEVSMQDGSKLLGEVWGRERLPVSRWADPEVPEYRIQLKTGNRDITGVDFVWVDEAAIASREEPLDVVEMERLEWGNFYGRLVEINRGEEVLATGSEPVWAALGALLEQTETQRAVVRQLEKDDIGAVNYEIERLRLAGRKLELDEDLSPSERATRQEALDARLVEAQGRYEALAERLFGEREKLEEHGVVVEAIDGTRKTIPIGQVVHVYRPNELSTFAKLRIYGKRLWEFVSGDPRESNTEGGIFPAIFGTVMMVFLMTFVVTPFGVLAALYLREYAKEGPFVRMVRIAVNNLAGVPSIVFGVFGLGFFVYVVGGNLDRLFFPESLPTPTFGTGGILWAALTLALLTVPVVIVASEEGLAAVPRIVREGSLALGATKFETLVKVVIPAAAPGILTGMILAMARAAGEVAPLMIVGMVKLAPSLPIDGYFPFVHFERKFMHLGFHIYDVGFQSPNVEATKPLVFATAFLLILVVVAMNLAAVSLRNRLREKYRGSAI